MTQQLVTQHFVLDASVAMRWALQDGSAVDRQYADLVLDSLATTSAWVPTLWYTETVHVLHCAEENKNIDQSGIAEFFYRLGHPFMPTAPHLPDYNWLSPLSLGNSNCRGTTPNIWNWRADVTVL